MKLLKLHVVGSIPIARSSPKSCNLPNAALVRGPFCGLAGLAQQALDRTVDNVYRVSRH